MVGGDHGDAAHLERRVHDLADALIHGLDGLDGGVVVAGVTDHVAVGKVEDDDVIRAGLNALDALFRDLVGAHLGLEVVGRDLGRGNEHTVLAGVGRFNAAVEEERDMGVLLGLRDAQLRQAELAEVFAEAVMDRDARERDEHVRHRGVVLGVADVGDGEILALEAVERGIDERAGDLAGAVGAVVEEDDGVVVGDGALLVADDGLHKFIGHAVLIGFPDGGDGIGILDALAVDHRVVGALKTVPAFVAVHGVVAAHDGRDLANAELGALFLRLGDEVRAGGGGDVAPVEEAVQVHALEALDAGHLQKRPDVLHGGVYAAVGEQSVEVQRRALFQTGVHRGVVGGIFKEGAVLNGAGDARQVLEDHAAAADVGVADLAVAHLTGGQAHVQTGGGELRMRVLAGQTAKHRRVCIARTPFAQP